MQRHSFVTNGLSLSWLDQGGAGTPLIALHAYWMEAGTYEDLAQRLAPDYRLIALDQRGHGQSDPSPDLSWDGFISDLSDFVRYLGLSDKLLLMGNSLGGTVAFRYAARNPGKVRALILEEAPVVEDGNLDFMRAWEGTYPTKDALTDRIGARLAWSVEPSFRETPQGWALSFSPAQLADAQIGLNGDFWQDWRASDCPALIIRGTESRAVDGKLLEDMADGRPNTRLQTFSAGHVVHHDVPEAFADAIRKFLDELP